MPTSEQRQIEADITRHTEQIHAWALVREDAVAAEVRAMELIETARGAQKIATEEIADETAERDRLIDLLPRQREP